DHHCGALACSDSGSNRNSVISDVDGAPDVSRERNVTRLATFQANLPMLQVASMSGNSDK
ncbi:protocadherin-9, partial [Biomphalaria glabrata]